MGALFSNGEKEGGESSNQGGQVPPLTNVPDIDLPLPASYDAAFVNEVISQSWPSLNKAVMDAVSTQLLPLLHRQLKILKYVLKVENVNVGGTAAKITGVDVYPKTENSTNIIVDILFEYKGEGQLLEAKLLAIPFGVKDVKASGRLRLLLGPLLPKFPLYGAISLFFLQAPEISFDFTGLANILDLPVVRAVFHDAIIKVISKEIVLPNRQVFVLDKASVNEDDLKHPPPRGVLSVTVVAVRDVDDTDWIGKPDIFVKLKVGTNQFQTHTVDDVTTAIFNESFEVMLTEFENRLLSLSVLDKDVVGTDPLGSAEVNLSRVKDMQELNMPLSNSKNGKIQLRVAWKEVSLVPANELLSPKVPSTGRQLLLVKLKETKNLPNMDKAQYYCEVRLDSKVEESKVAVKTGEGPNETLTFNDYMRFLFHYTPELNMEVKVLDGSPDDDNMTIGTFSIPLRQVLEADGALLDKHFPLKEGGHETVHLILQMRVLIPKSPPPTPSAAEASATSPTTETVAVDVATGNVETPEVLAEHKAAEATATDQGEHNRGRDVEKDETEEKEEEDKPRVPLLAVATGEVSARAGHGDLSPASGDVMLAVDGQNTSTGDNKEEEAEEDPPSLLEIATGQAAGDNKEEEEEKPEEDPPSLLEIATGQVAAESNKDENHTGEEEEPESPPPSLLELATGQADAKSDEETAKKSNQGSEEPSEMELDPNETAL